MEAEYNTLLKLGLPEDLALLSVGAKHGNEDVVNSVLNNLCDEQELLIEAMSGFKQMGLSALEYVPAEIIKPDPTKSLFVEINPITNEMKAVEIPQQQSSDTENLVIEIGPPSKPVYRLPIGKT